MNISYYTARIVDKELVTTDFGYQFGRGYING